MSNGLYTNFSSFTPFSCKIGLIKTLIHRTYAIISSWNLFHDEIKKTLTFIGEKHVSSLFV